MGQPKENALGKSYTNHWLFTSALQKEEIMIPAFVLTVLKPWTLISLNIPSVSNMIR
jgi:hypothetical protein